MKGADGMCSPVCVCTCVVVGRVVVGKAAQQGRGGVWLLWP